jgi:hypothetical protein
MSLLRSATVPVAATSARPDGQASFKRRLPFQLAATGTVALRPWRIHEGSNLRGDYVACCGLAEPRSAGKNPPSLTRYASPVFAA